MIKSINTKVIRGINFEWILLKDFMTQFNKISFQFPSYLFDLVPHSVKMNNHKGVIMVTVDGRTLFY